MWKNAIWLKLPEEEIKEKKIYHGDMTGRFAYFRCDVEIPAGAQLNVDITASSRYRLWVNGKAVLSGPCKGDTYRQYYEETELTEYLVPGKNSFCVQVLYCDPEAAEKETDQRASIYGVVGPTAGHRLAVEGDICDETGNVTGTITTGKADWRVWLENSFYLKSDESTIFLGAVAEDIHVKKSELHWKEKEYDVSGWRMAERADTVRVTDPLFACGVQPKFRIRKREIPLLYEETSQFVRCFTKEDGKSTGLLENKEMTIPAGAYKELIFDAGVIKNGYPCFVFSGGKDTKVEIIYFEKFGGPDSDICRSDYKNGAITGLTDTLILDGKKLLYEPFWVRTFRFLCLRIYAGQEPVKIDAPYFKRTGYPLPKESEIHSSAPWVEKLWKICVRTLGNCMMETYMDCPYYEQLQYGMDTRLEALYTYTVTNDSRLVKKALLDFHYGMMPDGLSTGKWPSAYPQILSTFSLHYIYMMWEYYKQTGDEETIRLYRGDVDRILEYYDSKIGGDGLVGRLEYWEFVDWQPAWNDCAGIPEACQHGPSTIINLMYAYALWCGEQIFEASGRKGVAAEYGARREKILTTVKEQCWDAEKEMFREGPAFTQYSCHAQAWAVLNELVDHAQAKVILSNAIKSEECLTCSFSTSYEWFRALEKAGMYKELRSQLNAWINLLELDCTACPEVPKGARSECHAWSALPMYEMMRTIAGVKPDGAGKQHITITPHLMDLTDVHGSSITPYGAVEFSYERENGILRYRLKIPENIRATIQFEDGETRELEKGGTVVLEHSVKK